MPYEDTMQIKVDPSNWGIFKMMARIEEITERFGPKLPKISDGGDFKAELQKTLDSSATAAPKAELKEEDDDLFAELLLCGGRKTSAEQVNPHEFVSQALCYFVECPCGPIAIFVSENIF